MNRLASWNGSTWSSLGSVGTGYTFAITVRPNGNVVVGRTTPVFAERTPQWVLASDFFPKPRNQEALGDLDPDPDRCLACIARNP